MKWMTFGSHFPSKIDEKIDAKIDAEKVMKFDENSMRKFNVFWIAILRKIGCVRKVPNANKPIKTNGFLMISWFARFKNRFGKLQKNMKKRSRKSDAKNIEKSSKKSSKIDAETMKKPLKNRSEKSNDF